MTSLTDPDNFKYDWYGYGSNQWTHVVMGASFYIYIHGVWYETFDTLAYRWLVVFACAAIYLTWEAVINKWNGWDSLEDFVFFTVYGAGFPAFVFKGVDGDSPSLSYAFANLLYCLSLVWFHVLTGVYLRWQNERRR